MGLPSEPAFQGVSWLGSEPPLQAAFFEVLPDRNYSAQLVGLVSDDGWKLIYDLERNVTLKVIDQLPAIIRHQTH